MRSSVALIRASWQSARTYRVRLLISIVSLGATVIPLYFIANALQPVLGESIATQGGQYFGFLVVGMVTFLLLPPAINALPSEIGSGINTGVLENLLGTPAHPAALFGGLIGFNMIWTGLRAGALLIAGWLLGAELAWSQLGSAVLILGLIVLAYLPVGMVSASLVIWFRTSGPLGQGILTISALLGGVYYPTTVIPSWIQDISGWIPLTYGLRALRRTLLEGEPLSAVGTDLMSLIGFVVVLTLLGSLALGLSLRHARIAGNLAQY